MNKKVWTVQVEQEGEDLMLPFPEDLLETMGWQAGDTLRWNVDAEGAVTISKVDNGKD